MTLESPSGVLFSYILPGFNLKYTSLSAGFGSLLGTTMHKTIVIL
jgi:hypothetical protein